MKRIILLFIIVVAVLLAIPGAIGTQAEGHYQKLIDYFKSNGAEVVSHRFHQGWFSSDAETQFALVMPRSGQDKKAGSAVERFTLTSRIKHGPLTESGGGVAEIDSDLRFQGEPLFPADYPGTIRTFIDFQGNGKTLLNLPAAEIAAQGARPQMRFGGISGELSFDAGFNALNLQLSSPGFAIMDAGGAPLDLGDLVITSSLQKSGGGLMLGSGRIEIGRLDVVDSESGDAVNFKGLAVEAGSHINEGGVIASSSYHFQRIDIDGEHYGPGKFGFSIEGLPETMLVKLQETLTDLRSRQLNEEERQLAVMQALVGSGQVLMESSPTLKIDPLAITTSSGEVKGHLSIRPVGLQLTDTQDLMKLLNKLEASASLAIPETLYRQLFRRQLEMQLAAGLPEGEKVPEDEEWIDRVGKAADRQLERLLQQGVLVREGKLLVTEASLAGGLLTINDKMIPVPGTTRE